LEKCAGDDIEGILITQEIGKKKRAIGRKSIIEFGWAVGEPEKTKTESYFHVKFDQTERASGRGDESTGANIGQNIFHRPASSGRYAIILNADLCRIGFPWKTKKNQMQEASYPPPSDDLFWSGLFTEISSSARKRAFFRLLSLIP